MALQIVKEKCIACYACEQECPTTAITQDKTGKFEINPKICVECVGFYEEPQCLAICPIDDCILKEGI